MSTKIREKDGKLFISFPKIGQLRSLISTINHKAHYAGQDENDNPIYDPSKKNPVLTFTGSVKLHGTNAGVSFSRKTGIYAQSRERLIFIDDDNHGFAMFVERNKEAFEKLFEPFYKYLKDDNSIITIFGEWAGKGIQSGVAISQLDKFFAIFDVKISLSLEDRFFLPISEWKDLKNEDVRIFNTQDAQTWSIDLDFEDKLSLEQSIQNMIEITAEVEKQCPFGYLHGVSGIGEGVVWVHREPEYGVIRFKVKGDKHQSSKVKKTIAMDPEVVKNIQEFVDYSVTENRLEQGFDIIFTSRGLDIDIKKMGEFLSWVARDIFSEEKDVLVESGLEMKQVGKYISKAARDWFLIKWNKF
jgi:hypothetical protein